MPLIVDIVVAGLGPTGLASALALSRLGLSVAAVGQPMQPARDTRAMALMAPSIALLDKLGVWDACAGQACALTGIRIIDATGRLLRAPETTFRATDIGQARFGACITTSNLVETLVESARGVPNLHIIETAAIRSIDIGEASVALTTAEGRRIEAALLVGADGRQSPARRAAGIGTAEWSYPQTALACSFRHTRPHDGLSIEFHRATGPLTTVPLVDAGGSHASSLVWVETPSEAQRLMALDSQTFAKALRTELHGVLGAVDNVTTRTAFPLGGLRAAVMAQRRTALVGEAAHVIPPIGAQGLNLGLRDVAGLADVIEQAIGRCASGSQPNFGSDSLLTHYATGRNADVRSRLTAVDLLNKSLLSAQLPVQALRGFGLHLLSVVPPLRRALIQQGLSATGAAPDFLLASPAGTSTDRS